MMIKFPTAKINIGLRVTSKRPDGFHNIETLFYPLALRDALEALPSKEFSINMYGIRISGKPDGNLCVKAYRLLQEAFDLPPVTINLYKAIPAGAGLGGGSSDAAAMLELLNGLFELSLSTKQLHSYALKLGSDCPFFLHRTPMIAGGRGEILSEYPMPALAGYSILLVKPPIHVRTAEAYARITPQQPDRLLTAELQQPVGLWKNTVINDFEATVFARHPLLARIKQQLYNGGAAYAAMSGSGSTLFGLFAPEEKEAARRAAKQIIATNRLETFVRLLPAN